MFQKKKHIGAEITYGLKFKKKDIKCGNCIAKRPCTKNDIIVHGLLAITF